MRVIAMIVLVVMKSFSLLCGKEKTQEVGYHVDDYLYNDESQDIQTDHCRYMPTFIEKCRQNIVQLMGFEAHDPAPPFRTREFSRYCVGKEYLNEQKVKLIYTRV